MTDQPATEEKKTSGLRLAMQVAKGKSKKAQQQRFFTEAFAQQNSEQSSNEQNNGQEDQQATPESNGNSATISIPATVTTQDSTQTENNQTPESNGNHTTEATSESSTSDETKTADQNEDDKPKPKLRSWKLKYDAMQANGSIRKAKSAPELNGNANGTDKGRAATVPPAKGEVDGLFKMFKDYKSTKKAAVEKANADEMEQSKSLQEPKKSSKEGEPHMNGMEQSDERKSLSRGGSLKKVDFTRNQVVEFKHTQAPINVNPITQVNDKLKELEEENKRLEDRIRQLETNPSASNSVPALQQQLQKEILAKNILKDYINELQEEINSMKKTAPKNQFKTLLFVQLFLWVVVIGLLFYILTRRRIFSDQMYHFPPS